MMVTSLEHTAHGGFDPVSGFRGNMTDESVLSFDYTGNIPKVHDLTTVH